MNLRVFIQLPPVMFLAKKQKLPGDVVLKKGARKRIPRTDKDVLIASQKQLRQAR